MLAYEAILEQGTPSSVFLLQVLSFQIQLLSFQHGALNVKWVEGVLTKVQFPVVPVKNISLSSMLVMSLTITAAFLHTLPAHIFKLFHIPFLAELHDSPIFLFHLLLSVTAELG